MRDNSDQQKHQALDNDQTTQPSTGEDSSAPKEVESTGYKYVVKDLWEAEGINFIAGLAKAGKSRWSGQMLVSVLRRVPNRMGLEVGEHTPENLLYITDEDPQDVAGRLNAYAKMLGVRDLKLPISCLRASKVDLSGNDEWLMLTEFIELEGFDALFIDSLRFVHNIEHSNTEMGQICDTIRSWTDDLGVTLFITHCRIKFDISFDITRPETWLCAAAPVRKLVDTASLLWRKSDLGPEATLYRTTRMGARESLPLYDGSDPWEPGGTGWRLNDYDYL